MSILNRSMFQRPMPVVRRMAGTPKTGEQNYEDKGYDAYEYRADQDMDSSSLFDKIKNSKIVQGINDFLDKPTDQYGEGNNYVLDEYEFGLLYPNVSFDSVTVEERTINTEGDDYRRLVELTTSGRANGSPIQGENSYYSQTINPEIVKEQDIVLDKQTGSHEQWLRENDAAVNRIITTNLKKVAEGNVIKPTVILDAVANSFNRFGKDETLKMLMEGNFHKTNSKIFQYISSLDEYFPGTFFYDDNDGDFVGMSDDYYFENMPNQMKKYVDPLMEIMSTDIVSRKEGSPKFGEMIKDGNYLAGLLEYLDKMKIEDEEKRKLFKKYLEEHGFPNFEKFFKDKDIDPGENMPYIINPDDPPFKPSKPEPYIIYPDDERKIGVELLSRNQGSPMQGEQVNVENVGIMDGFSGDGSEAEAMAILEEGKRAEKEIEDTTTYDELMRSIRGDDLSEADRRQELASYVGEKDAEETPDSVLTLVQPVMQMLDEGTANTGIGQIEEGREMATIAPTQQDAEEMMAMNMPQQPVGVANGGYMSGFPNQNMGTQSLTASDNIDDRIMQNLQFERMTPGMMGYANGGQVQHFSDGDLATIQDTYNERLPLYMDIINNPERKKGNTLLDISTAFLNYGMGGDPKESLSYFLNKTGQRADQQDKTEQAIKMGALNAAIGKFDAKELATLKALAEKSKKNKTMVVGLTRERDRMIAKLLGLTKPVDKQNFGGAQDNETELIDFEKLYKLYPNGTELQFNNNFTEFLGKKGSGIRYEGVKKEAAGGIVHREEGTPEEGEISEVSGGNLEDYDFGIFEVPVITGTSERDDITKLLLGSKKALYELAEMKQYLLDDPSVGGVPGLVLEKLRGVFTMFDQLDNAYLDDKYIKSDTGIYKFFDKPQITSISNSKKRISKALADLTSFKGARQATTGQIEKTEEQIDPVGGFGSTVSLEKIDEVGDEFVGLLKQLLLGLGGLEPRYKQSDTPIVEQEGILAKDTIVRAKLDPEWVNLQWSRLDNWREDLINMTPSENSVQKTKDELEKLENKKVLTIQQYEDLFGSIASRANESQ